MSSYRDLAVWKKSMDLVTEVYRLTRFLPKEETYALSDQMRRAAVSIPSNIAEGQSRNSPKEFLQFLYVARGSKAELETQLLIAERLQYLPYEQISGALTMCDDIGRMLHSLINRIKQSAIG